jgi:hypothetical protein
MITTPGRVTDEQAVFSAPQQQPGASLEELEQSEGLTGEVSIGAGVQAPSQTDASAKTETPLDSAEADEIYIDKDGNLHYNTTDKK